MWTMRGMMIEPGAIVRVPFPFSNLAVVKKRPVLVLSVSDEHGDFLCMAVTSKGNHAGALAINDTDVVTGSLRLASWVRPNKVFRARKKSTRFSTLAHCVRGGLQARDFASRLAAPLRARVD